MGRGPGCPGRGWPEQGRRGVDRAWREASGRRLGCKRDSATARARGDASAPLPPRRIAPSGLDAAPRRPERATRRVASVAGRPGAARALRGTSAPRVRPTRLAHWIVVPAFRLGHPRLDGGVVRVHARVHVHAVETERHHFHGRFGDGDLRYTESVARVCAPVDLRCLVCPRGNFDRVTPSADRRAGRFVARGRRRCPVRLRFVRSGAFGVHHLRPVSQPHRPACSQAARLKRGDRQSMAAPRRQTPRSAARPRNRCR